MPNESFLANPDIVLRTEEGGAFLFDPDTGRICFVNDVGITIWRLCKKPAALAEIIHQVELNYTEVPSQKVAADCRDFLGQLGKLDFLVPTAVQE
ncbi:MAG: PqqD family protein [Desulfobacterales bacterium]|nr:PqqD family protein [Desulfobacterales bacterium]